MATRLWSRTPVVGAFVLSTALGLAAGAFLFQTAANYARAVQAVYGLRMAVVALALEADEVRFAGRIRNDSAVTLWPETLTVRFWVNGRPVGNGRLDFAGQPLPSGEGLDFVMTARVDPDHREYVRSLPGAGLVWELEGRLACYLPFGVEKFSVPLRGRWPG